MSEWHVDPASKAAERIQRKLAVAAAMGDRAKEEHYRTAYQAATGEALTPHEESVMTSGVSGSTNKNSEVERSPGTQGETRTRNEYRPSEVGHRQEWIGIAGLIAFEFVVAYLVRASGATGSAAIILYLIPVLGVVVWLINKNDRD